MGTDPDVAGLYLRDRRKVVTRPAGHQVIRMTVARSLVMRKCRKYRYCKLYIGTWQAALYSDAQGIQHAAQFEPPNVSGQDYATLVVKKQPKPKRKHHRK